jgi:signal peptidase II
VVVVDQITKWWALEALADGRQTPVLGDFFGFRLVFNTGASFSLFPSGGQVIGVIAAAVVVFTWALVGRLEHRWDVAGVAIVMGGALGNLIDRLFRGDGFLDGAVVDFLDFSFFPTFNVADTAINVGVAILLLGAFRREARDGG